MNKQQILDFWIVFFKDLLLGTFKNLFLFGICGFLSGAFATYVFDLQVLDTAEWNVWLEGALLVLVAGSYLSLGLLHGWISCSLHMVSKKMREALSGLQELLDWLTREVIGRFPRFQKNIPKHELAQKYDQIGNELRLKLKQRGGITGFTSSVLFGVILKVLRFFFLDEVVEELHKKDKEEITSADIEHAVRRVGTEVMIAPITDNLFLLQIVNIITGLLLFALPFSLLWFI
ncbi:MAG: hypothetical protein H8E42_00215 [Nitrospinae bacterium]|nr:hypothetical protein [Nitrospinota bacterium]MBL7021677.1 hypothetical protein [Nitrospinaceae bacterium]